MYKSCFSFSVIFIQRASKNKSAGPYPYAQGYITDHLLFETDTHLSKHRSDFKQDALGRADTMRLISSVCYHAVQRLHQQDQSWQGQRGVQQQFGGQQGPASNTSHM